MYSYMNLVKGLERLNEKISVLSKYLEADQDKTLDDVPEQLEEHNNQKERMHHAIIHLLSKDYNLLKFRVGTETYYQYCKSCEGMYPNVLEIKKCIKCNSELKKKRGNFSLLQLE
jgi:predicted GNAT superfamily acetyltransferase